MPFGNSGTNGYSAYISRSFRIGRIAQAQQEYVAIQKQLRRFKSQNQYKVHLSIEAQAENVVRGLSRE